jgi:hypothetical protein
MRKAILIFLLAFLAVTNVSAQCAMCKRVAETDMQNKRKETSARSLNNGILYLLSIPYLIGGVGAAMWWYNKKKS